MHMQAMVEQKGTAAEGPRRGHDISTMHARAFNRNTIFLEAAFYGAIVLIQELSIATKHVIRGHGRINGYM